MTKILNILATKMTFSSVRIYSKSKQGNYSSQCRLTGYMKNLTARKRGYFYEQKIHSMAPGLGAGIYRRSAKFRCRGTHCARSKRSK